jgi:hypothetical protein
MKICERFPSKRLGFGAVYTILKIVVKPILNVFIKVLGVHMVPFQVIDEHVRNLAHAVFIAGPNIIDLIDGPIFGYREDTAYHVIDVDKVSSGISISVYSAFLSIEETDNKLGDQFFWELTWTVHIISPYNDDWKIKTMKV